MATETEITLSNRTVAYMFIKSQPGRAEDVAREVSRNDPPYDPKNPDDSEAGYSWVTEEGEELGARFAVVVTGPFHVLVGIRVVDNHELGDLVRKIKRIDGIANPDVGVMTSYFKGGDDQRSVRNGPP